LVAICFPATMGFELAADPFLLLSPKLLVDALVSLLVVILSVTRFNHILRLRNF